MTIPEQIGRYQIKSELGRGGMAVVYHAIDPQFGREVAIKVLPHEFLHDPTFRARFVREAQIIATLDHPAIVPVYDAGDEGGQPFLVMRYMGGGSLAERIHKGPLALEDAARIVSRLAPAIDEAHSKGIIHRDIKPSNVLFDQRDEAHLADFGIVRLSEATAHLTGTGIVGTPAYMAPEMANPEGLSPLVDVYALGVTLYQMLTGKQPYEADTPMGILMAHMGRPIPNVHTERPDLPEGVQRVIERALAKDPADRYQSVGEVANDLQLALSGLTFSPGLTPSPSPLVERGEVERGDTMPVPMQPTGRPPAPPVDRIGATAPMQEARPVMVAPPRPEIAPARRGAPGWVWAVVGMVVVIGVCVVVGGLVLGGTLLGDRIPVIHFGPTDTPTPTPTATPTPIPPGYPGNPVSANGQWTPMVRQFDGVDMALVPVGCFVLGSTDDQLDYAISILGSDGSWIKNEQPTQQICFDQPFWIDRTEVTNEQFNRLGGQANSSSGWTGADRPRETLTWYEARAFCELRGARLPTEPEWEYAARGPDNLIFPWGNDFIADNVVYEGNSGDHTWDVGSKPGGVSWVGALDMSGNVYEYASSLLMDYPYDANDGREETNDSYSYILRSGAWDRASYYVRATFRDGYCSSCSGNIGGVRCVRDWSPGD